MTAPTPPSPLLQFTVAAIRSRIAAGETDSARSALAAARAHLGPAAEILVTEGLLHEAGGDLEAALASFEEARAAAPGSVRANAHLARILLRLERPDRAETAALATLALDGDNAHALAALAFAYDRAGRIEESLGVARRLAASPDTAVDDAWAAIGALAGVDRWTDILGVLDARGEAWPPERVCVQRVEALLELGRQRDALASLVAAETAGHVESGEMVDRLVERHAFAVAAGFVHQCLEGRPGASRARTTVVAAARRTCDQTTLEAAPFEFSDAVHALSILLPDREALHKAVARAVILLVRQGRAHLAKGEFSAATDNFIRAGRLAPADPTVLGLLGEAAAGAGNADRHLDTLVRIHRAHPDTASLVPAVIGAISAGRWDTVGALMARAENVGLLSSDLPEAIEDLRESLPERLDDLLRGGDLEGALGLAVGLSSWMTSSQWPPGVIGRLLAAAKLRLRSPPATSDIGRLAALCLRIDPDDGDAGQLLARFNLRNRRFGEAVEVLAGLMRGDPHSARDWLDFSHVHDELGEPPAGRWDTVGELAARAEKESQLFSGASEPIDDFRSRLPARLDEYLRDGNLEGGLGLVAGLKPWMTRSDWPPGPYARLLAAAKRRLRNPSAASGVAQLAGLYLRVDPDDVDAGRLLARLHLSHRCFAGAAEVLADVMRVDPHLARDWLDLAQAHGELGDPAKRDACMARALVIAPTSLPGRIQDDFWARTAPA